MNEPKDLTALMFLDYTVSRLSNLGVFSVIIISIIHDSSSTKFILFSLSWTQSTNHWFLFCLWTHPFWAKISFRVLNLSSYLWPIRVLKLLSSKSIIDTLIGTVHNLMVRSLRKFYVLVGGIMSSNHPRTTFLSGPKFDWKSKFGSGLEQFISSKQSPPKVKYGKCPYVIFRILNRNYGHLVFKFETPIWSAEIPRS